MSDQQSQIGVEKQFVKVSVCPVCGSRRHKLFFKGNQRIENGSKVETGNYACTASSLARYFDIFRCKECHLVYSGYRPSEQALDKVYRQVVDEVYLEQEEGRCRTFSAALKDLGRLCPGRGRLLEIGSYTGVFLGLARSAGWQVFGMEFSDWARRVAWQRRNLDTMSSFRQLDGLGKNFFDSVVMWDVIEHAADPGDLLHKARTMLRSGGVLGLSTIVLDSLSAKVFRGKYPFLMEMHLVYFTRRTLTRLLREHGFRIIRYKRHWRKVSYAYALDKFAFSRPLKRIDFLWRFLGQRYFASSVGLRDIYAVKE